MTQTLSNDVQGIKLFSIDDYEWVAAQTLEDAQAFYLDLATLENVTIEEMSLDAMDRYTYFKEDDTQTTFREELIDRVTKGEKFPQYFACGEF